MEKVPKGETKKNDPIYLLREMESKLNNQITKLSKIMTYNNGQNADNLRAALKHLKGSRREQERVEKNRQIKAERERKKKLIKDQNQKVFELFVSYNNNYI